MFNVLFERLVKRPLALLILYVFIVERSMQFGTGILEALKIVTFMIPWCLLHILISFAQLDELLFG